MIKSPLSSISSMTKKKDKGSSKYGEYILIYSGKNKNERAASGVGLQLHEKFETHISDVKNIDDRRLHVTVGLQISHPTHILSVYAPDTSKPQADIGLFYHTLQTTLDDIANEDEILILGDFNARIGDEAISDGIKNRFNEETMNESGDQMVQLCMQDELRINNTLYPHKPQHKYTFENTRGHRSIIDYVVSNKNIHPTRKQDVRSLASANAGTDHHLVLAKIRTDVQPPHKKSTETRSIFNIESLSDDSTKQLYRQRLRRKIVANNIQDFDDVETAWAKLRTNILEAAEEAFGKRTIKKGGKPNTKPWFKQEVKMLAEEKRKSYLQYRSNTVTYDEYKSVRNRVNENIRKIKRDH
ncbi:craniofacial development protein 2-like [Harmonia axyridis]|uniref:craniofacial development protein 2-like n=1 Tax=Harmonia axyridis TaxID=115357 RepID=UPI001E2776AD|nr:craniofacial development protein 2-like [Harmonia axyridis]